MSNLINVERGNAIVAQRDYNDFTTEHNPEPTSRVLDGSRDHGWGQEWAVDGTLFINGEHIDARMIFLFDDDDIEDEDQSKWPWEDRAARIEIA